MNVETGVAILGLIVSLTSLRIGWQGLAHSKGMVEDALLFVATGLCGFMAAAFAIALSKSWH